MANFMEMVKWEDLLEATRETIYMTSISVFATFVLGLHSWSAVIFNG